MSRLERENDALRQELDESRAHVERRAAEAHVASVAAARHSQSTAKDLSLGSRVNHSVSPMSPGVLASRRISELARGR